MFDLVMDESYKTLVHEERPNVRKWLEDRPHLNRNAMTVFAGRECRYITVKEYLEGYNLEDKGRCGLAGCHCQSLS